jgi:hypothetical protein
MFPTFLQTERLLNLITLNIGKALDSITSSLYNLASFFNTGVLVLLIHTATTALAIVALVT